MLHALDVWRLSPPPYHPAYAPIGVTAAAVESLQGTSKCVIVNCLNPLFLMMPGRDCRLISLADAK